MPFEKILSDLEKAAKSFKKATQAQYGKKGKE